VKLSDVFKRCRTKLMTGEYTDTFGPTADVLKCLGATEKMMLMVLELEYVHRTVPLPGRAVCLNEIALHYGMDPVAPETPEGEAAEEGETDDLPMVNEPPEPPREEAPA